MPCWLSFVSVRRASCASVSFSALLFVDLKAADSVSLPLDRTNCCPCAWRVWLRCSCSWLLQTRNLRNFPFASAMREKHNTLATQMRTRNHERAITLRKRKQQRSSALACFKHNRAEQNETTAAEHSRCRFPLWRRHVQHAQAQQYALQFSKFVFVPFLSGAHVDRAKPARAKHQFKVQAGAFSGTNPKRAKCRGNLFSRLEITPCNIE